MHSIEIVGTKIVLQYPENGTEFNREQLLSFSRLMLLLNTDLITYDDFKVRLTYEFLNLRRSADLSLPENKEIVENVYLISQFVDAYFSEKREDGKAIRVVEMQFYNQVLPEVKIGNRTYYGPDSALLNTKYGEYIQALTAFVDFSKSGKGHFLDTLIATLYRPENPDNDPENPDTNYSADRRREFNPELTEHYARSLKNLNADEKHAIYLFFASCQHFIATNTSLDIGGGNTIDLSVLFKQEPGSNAVKSLGLVGTLYSIAESRVFGNVKEVAGQNTYDVLAYLVDQYHKMKKLKPKKKSA